MNWKVKFIDFPLQWERQRAELLPLIDETLARGDVMLRQQLVDFERHLADFVGTTHGVGVSNCTDGLRLLAHNLDVGQGDEVVTVAHTFIATVSPFVLRGARPVFVDIGDDQLMDTSQLASVVTKNTKVIIPVHLNGRTVEMDEVLKVAASVGATVIEDAAQALGAHYDGRVAGTMGLASTYSFYPAKMLGCMGDGGAVLTDDPALAKDLYRLRDHGRVTKTEVDGWGYNCRLDNLQAAILDYRLTKLPAWIDTRRKIASIYHEKLEGLDGLDLPVGPDEDSRRRDVFQNYTVMTDNRDELFEHLKADGIEVLISWPVPFHKQTNTGLAHWDLPNTERLSRRVLSLPMNAELEESQAEYVADSVLRFSVRERSDDFENLAPANKASYRLSKRLFDLLVTVPIAAVLSPFALVVAAVIRFCDGGPALYPAKRVGVNGEEFTMYKFRTMVINADAIGGASTSAGDQRITHIGRWLRRWKLDEIPQLINVIRGDMSLVGPRPTLDWDVARYSEDERRLLSVRPGITDWASIKFRDEGEILREEIDPDEAYDRIIRPEIRLGLQYVDHASLRQDLSILMATMKAIAGHDPDARMRVPGGSETPAFFKVTENWSTYANEQQWQLARQRYSLAAALGHGKVLAEVGCGTGYGLAQVARFTKSATGLDIDEQNVAVARSFAPHCEFLLGNAEALPFGDAELDCLVALEMLYYLPDHRAFMAEAGRTIRPGGSLLVSMPNPQRAAFQSSPFSTHYPTGGELRELMVRAGFDVKLYGACPLKGSGPTFEFLRRTLVGLHLIPETIEGRAKLKRLVFRDMRRLESIDVDPCYGYEGLTPVTSPDVPPDYGVLVSIGRRL